MTALSEGAIVVTPTPLLASAALEQFNRVQLAGENESWERPAIYSLDAWMAMCWQQARFSVPNVAALLSLSQERELWRQIIERDRPDLFDVRAMASIAQRAAWILAEYYIPAEGEPWTEQMDAQRFQRWHQTLQQQLQAENWITRSELWGLIPGWINRDAINPGDVVFAGLTSVSPGLQRFRQRNVGVTPSQPRKMAVAACFDSAATEMEQAARAARYLLENSPSPSVGVLVVDLPSQAGELRRVFNNVFYPDSTERGHIHVQFGSSLTQPLISSAILLLELAQGRISHSSAGAILRSPFIEGEIKERSARALANQKLRRARELDFSIADIEKVSGACPAFVRMLRRVRAVMSKMLPIMRLSDWSTAFSDILDAVKWPAIENITEAEQGAVDQWNRALSELASLGLVSPPVRLNQALTNLRDILGRPSEQGDWSSPIQILDANSVEGIEFDQAFVLNAAEGAWPMAGGLSALIPYRLQRLHNVPGSHPEPAEEERSRKTQALCTSATSVHVSFTGSMAPAFRHYVELGPELPAMWAGRTAAESYPCVDLQAQDDSQAPALVQTGKTTGGAGILKAQSLCPFKAFAEYRLNARGDDDACFGFDALDRGTFAHTALELIWRRLGTQAHLKALSENDLEAMVQDCVAQAVQDDGSGPIRSLTSDAERERLIDVVSRWLAVERERPEPFTVEQVEQNREVELAGLKLALRADRIDRMPDGSLVLIDYKTGAQTKTKLENERPEEPQLLVYAAVVKEQVSGLYFAELKNDKVRAVGHGTGRHFLKQAVKDHSGDWDDFIENSKATVERLAQEFARGDAAVDPLKKACAYCKVKPICRIGTVGDDDEGEEW